MLLAKNPAIMASLEHIDNKVEMITLASDIIKMIVKDHPEYLQDIMSKVKANVTNGEQTDATKDLANEPTFANEEMEEEKKDRFDEVFEGLDD